MAPKTFYQSHALMCANTKRSSNPDLSTNSIIWGKKNQKLLHITNSRDHPSAVSKPRKCKSRSLLFFFFYRKRIISATLSAYENLSIIPKEDGNKTKRKKRKTKDQHKINNSFAIFQRTSSKKRSWFIEFASKRKTKNRKYIGNKNKQHLKIN